MAEKKTPKLHEVLAVEGDLESQATKVMQEAAVTFEKKANHFLGYSKWLEMFDENRKQEEEGGSEQREIVDSVKGKLDHVWKYYSKYVDAVSQKERTNQDARADLVVDGQTLAEGLPATLLLGLESRLKKMRSVYDSIPTHAPGISWELDVDKGKGIFKASHLITKSKTEKVVRHQVLVEPTEHHPAQIDKWDENVAVGVFKTQHWTSNVSPAQKAEWLEKIDKLLRGVKKARQRANNTEIVKIKVGHELKKFIHG